MKTLYVDPHPAATKPPQALKPTFEDEIRVVAAAAAKKLGADNVEITDVHTEIRYALHVGVSCHADVVLSTAIAAAVRAELRRHAAPADELDIVVEHVIPTGAEADRAPE